ncbi:hypothetical protein C8J57DRAFT_1229980 [Mycena rebaudengoi]|nr:hypothetical protein C8J57DRAFT_1229980 [Mycena rebaudengoi]
MSKLANTPRADGLSGRHGILKAARGPDPTSPANPISPFKCIPGTRFGRCDNCICTKNGEIACTNVFWPHNTARHKGIAVRVAPPTLPSVCPRTAAKSYLMRCLHMKCPGARLSQVERHYMEENQSPMSSAPKKILAARFTEPNRSRIRTGDLGRREKSTLA